jgi:transposase
MRLIILLWALGCSQSAEAQKKKRQTNRGSLPAHLPRVHVTLTPDSTAPCCHGVMHVIGEEAAERLDKIPAQYQVIVTHRPKYGCRACEGAVVQVPAAERLIKSGIPTENLVADVVVDKYAWHKPLYHQAQIMRLQGLPVDRSTLAGWVSAATRRHCWRVGIVHCDGYTVYKQLADPQREGGPATLAFCWTHWRRGFVEIDEGGPAPIAHEALERIAALYAIENRIRGRSADERRAIRQTETRPLVEALKTWLENRLAAVSDKSTIAEVIRYGFNHWQGLVRFLDDGRIEMDTNSAERAMRPIALNRRNSLFAGHDQGAVNWACIASLIETAKLQDIDPKPYVADILSKLVNGWPMAKIDELLPWAWAQHSKARLAA